MHPARAKHDFARRRASVAVWSRSYRRAEQRQNAVPATKPYMPTGSLREALSHPDAPERFNEAAYETALEMAQLSHLKTRLDEHNGGRGCSPAANSSVYRSPDCFYSGRNTSFDEATSALDEENEKTLYQTMLAFCPI